MRIGVLDILVDSPCTWVNYAYRALLKKQYASIAPQAVAVWCRQLGHSVTYVAYYGQKDPRELLPADLDVVFIATYTQSSALSYALAKLYRKDGVLTVIGGPHAKSFPMDCLRFFDLVVLECDKPLIEQLLRGGFDRGSIVTSGRPLREFPSVEERLPEIEASAFTRGKPVRSTIVPILSSVGCPYTCDFCVDWNNPYAALAPERVEADLAYLSDRWPSTLVAFHDPNFGVRFDEVLSSIEKTPRHARNPYIMESSLSLLKGPRLKRLAETGCVYVAPGVESWESYSQKSGVGQTVGREKLEKLVAHFEEIGEHVKGIQANFIFGSDVDRGDEPVELTNEFMRRLPFVWPTINIPTPFGGTPLYEQYLAEDRILGAMPFTFYYTPFLVTTLKHYDPVEYYEKLVTLYSVMTSVRMMKDRVLTDGPPALRFLHVLRSLAMKKFLSGFHKIGTLLRTDPGFRSFHEGRTRVLPPYYHRAYEARLGAYASLLSAEDRTPDLRQAPVLAAAAAPATGEPLRVAQIQ